MSSLAAKSGRRGGATSAARLRGFTLIEVTVALAVITLAVGATAWLMSSSRHQQRGLQTGQELMRLVDNIHTQYSSVTDYSGLTEVGAINDGLVPASLRNGNNIVWRDGDVMLQVWNPPASINSLYNPANNNRYFNVSVYGIRGENCLQLTQPLVESAQMFYAQRFPGGTNVSAFTGATNLTFFDWSNPLMSDLGRKNFLNALCAMPGSQTVALHLFFS